MIHLKPVVAVLLALICVVGAGARAQEPTPQQLRSLAELLRDPAVQGWLEREAGGEAAPETTAESPPPERTAQAARPSGAEPVAPAGQPGGMAPPARAASGDAAGQVAQATPPSGAEPAAPAAQPGGMAPAREAPGDAAGQVAQAAPPSGAEPAAPAGQPGGMAPARAVSGDAAGQGSQASRPEPPAPAAAGGPPAPADGQAGVRAAFDATAKAGTGAGAGAAAAAAAPAAAAEATMQAAAGDALAKMRRFLAGVLAAAPRLPQEFSGVAGRFAAATGERGLANVLLLLAAFVALGTAVELALRRATRALRRRIIMLPNHTVGERLQAAWLRTAYGLLLLASFAVGSVGAFLLFSWPPVLAEIVLGYLSAFLLVRLVLVFGRIVLAPGAPRFRMVPLSTPAARFWFVWSAILVGWFRFVQVTLEALARLGMDGAAVAFIGLAMGLVLVALTLSAIWRHPRADGLARTGGAHRLSAWLLSVYVVAVWLVLFSGSVAPFYIGVTLLLLPIALRGLGGAVRHLTRPPEADADADAAVAAEAAAPPPPLFAVTLERTIRALLLIAAAYYIAFQAGLDLDAMTTQDTFAARLVRGAVNAFAILLLADLVWHVARAWIDRRLAEAGPLPSLHGAEGEGIPVVRDPSDARRQARLRTLLPMLRNVLFVVVLVVAGLMALTSFGIDVAPLIAGAGVFGLAIGFGAQTLVKDLISGVFFLIDDAFRVGEYIESGSIRGTVEAFSLRSIKLRHHRGALHTIPFGTIEKVTNYSRDWTIDKMSINVTYDSDLDKAKKLIKEIGRELEKDPEFGHAIIQPLKMQGVETFGDYAIELRLKMMTKPGEQFVIRRRAYTMIKRAFDANGIEFAFPTVKVAGGDQGDHAAAQAVLDARAAAPSPA